MKNHLVLASASLLLLMALAAVFFIWPNYRDAAAMHREIEALQNRIAGLQHQEHVLDELKTGIAAAQQRIDNELKSIPAVPDLASLIRRLSQEVDRVAVLDQTFTAGSPCEAVADTPKRPGAASASASAVPATAKRAEDWPVANAMAMPLTVDMEANFDSVFALIRNAESMERLVRVSSVRLLCKRDDKTAARAPTPMLKASVGLEAIYFAANPTSAK